MYLLLVHNSFRRWRGTVLAGGTIFGEDGEKGRGTEDFPAAIRANDSRRKKPKNPYSRPLPPVYGGLRMKTRKRRKMANKNVLADGR
jgi:hypothetical protein